MGLSISKPVKHSMVVAIDFGTSYSGYAFAYRHSKHEILLNDNWGQEVGVTFYKAPTSVLYDENGEFDSFGFQSEKNYFQMLENDKASGLSYFRSFKMKLYGKETLGPDLEIDGEGGCKKAASDVFADALHFIKDKFLDRINPNGSLSDEDLALIRWVVTVPAIWNDRQKIFMRQACLKAGIINKLHSQNLIIALEPECASLYCRELAWNQFVGLDRSVQRLGNGTIYMVVDLGGGTVDITVHKLIKEQTAEEVIPPKGGNRGGNDVNLEFEGLLKRILGENFLDHLIKTMPEMLPHMKLDFEKAKRTFEETNPTVHIPLHYGLVECFEEFTGKRIRDLLKGDEINVSGSGNIVIGGETMKKFFSTVVDDIYTEVYDAIRACPEGSKPSYIYLVGGLSESKYVQERIKNLERICKYPKPLVMIPHEASLCVLKGAVKFGQNSKSIKMRFSKFTYALLLEREFKPEIDDEVEKFTEGGREMVKYFKTILPVGDPLKRKSIKSVAISMGKEGKDFHASVYTSGGKINKHPNACDVKQFANIVIKGNGQKTAKNIKVTLQFIFWITELVFKVIDSKKKEVLCNVDYT